LGWTFREATSNRTPQANRHLDFCARTMLAASECCTAAVAEGGTLYICGHGSDDAYGNGNCGRLAGAQPG